MITASTADELIKLIDSIGAVNKDSGDKIKAIRAAYDELSKAEQAKVTNYQKLTALWRLDGKPSADTAAGFTDLASGVYYTDAVAWANANGIVKGYSDMQFAPNDKVTREPQAAILYRYAEFKGYDVSGSVDLGGFTDNSKISAYALDNLKWANAAGLMNGRTSTTLAPQGDSTRAEVATMIQRFVNNITK